MTTPRRICLVAPEFIGPFPNGGVGTACYWEASTLAAAGYDVTVLYTGPTDRETPEHWEQAYAHGPFTYVDLWRAAREPEPVISAARVWSPTKPSSLMPILRWNSATALRVAAP